MRPTEEQLRAALTKQPIPYALGGEICPEDGEEYYREARGFIAVAYWELQRAIHDIQKLVDALPVEPEGIHEIEDILEEKRNDDLR